MIIYKRAAVIFDIDGTLANNESRRYLIEDADPANRKWKEFNDRMGEDTVNPHVLRLLNSFRDDGFFIILVSGRSDEYRKLTETWLTFHGVDWNELWMRPAGDYRPDTEIKLEIYRDCIVPRAIGVQLVVDDRASVVKMWRSLGLECWQVAEGNF